MKRLSVALAAVCAVHVAMPVVAGAAGSTSKSLTFHLVEKQAAFNFIDNPPRQGLRQPPLMGDQFVFTRKGVWALAPVESLAVTVCFPGSAEAGT